MEKTDSERIAVIETTVTDIKQRLFGNGQPGELDHLHTRVSSVGNRVAKLENWRWWVVGIAVGLGVALGGTARAIAEALLK